MKKDYGKIKKGFAPLLPFMEKGGNYIASCSSCAYFYPQNGQEQCNRAEVSQFDMCERDNGDIFCCYWKSVGMERKSRE